MLTEEKKRLLTYRPLFLRNRARLAVTRTLYATSGIGFIVVSFLVPELKLPMTLFSFLHLLVTAVCQYYINGFDKALAIMETWEKNED